MCPFMPQLHVFKITCYKDGQNNELAEIQQDINAKKILDQFDFQILVWKRESA